MESLQTQKFENQRWSHQNQKIVWRHKAAFELVTEQPVLDVGGGDGIFLRMLQERKKFERLSMLDISSVAVQKAQEQHIDALLTDITAPFPFHDKTFATACALDVLEHLYMPLSTLREMARVARTVVFVVPNFHHWKARVQMLTGQIPFQCKPKRGHLHWFNHSVLKELVAQTDLHLDSMLLESGQRLGMAGQWLAKYSPNLFAYSFAVKLTQKISP